MQTFIRSRRYDLALLVIALGALSLHAAFSAEPSDPPHALLFLGRMHPLVVHLPIGVLLLVAFLELVALHPAWRDQLQTSLDVILPVAVLTAFAAFALGIFLAQEGGFSAQRLNLHRRLALATVVFACFQAWTWTHYRRNPSPTKNWLYRGAMATTLGALSLASHQGGTLSRGETYLAKYAPEILKPLLGASAEKIESTPPPAKQPTSEPTVLSDAVQPLLNKYCVSCHGEEKVKGGLRLDSFEALQKGGDSGKTIIPFDGAHSSLVSRMRLPEGDDDRMPPDGEEAPTEAEIELIQFWIDRGATTELQLRDLLPPSEARKTLERALAQAHNPSSTTNPTSIVPHTAQQEPTEDRETPAEGETPSPDVDRDDEETAEPSETKPQSTGGGFEILQTRCGTCHGAKKQKGKLRVDSLAALARGGTSGAAVVWGNPASSLIVQSIRLPLGDPDHMPPKKKPQVTAEELASIERWIVAQGGRHSDSPRSRTESSSPEVGSSFAKTGDTDLTTTQTREGDDAPVEEVPFSGSNPDACTDPSQELPTGEVWLFDDVLQPLLSEKCSGCHSDDLASGSLKLHDCAGVHRGGNEGPSVVPREPNTSPLIQRVELPLGDDEHMPPEDYPQVTDDERLLLKDWISQGANRSITTPLKALPAAMRQALASSSPQRFGNNIDGEAPAQNPSNNSPSAPPEAIPPTSGGCAACHIGSHAPFGALGWWSLLLASAAWRRRRS